GLQASRARVDGFIIKFDHALLAGIGIYAGEADRQRRIAVGTDPAQAIEQRLARLKRNIVGFPAASIRLEPAPELDPGRIATNIASAMDWRPRDISMRRSRSVTV